MSTEDPIQEPPADMEPRPRQGHGRIDRLPPHSIEAEQGVLGCILLDPVESMGLCADGLKAGAAAFYDLRHQTLFGCLHGMHNASQPMDIISVQQRLRDDGRLESVGGIEYLAGLQDSVPSAAILSHYLAIVREKHTLRKLLNTCAGAIARVHEHEGEVESLLDEVEGDILRINEDRLAESNGSGLCNSKHVLKEFLTELEHRHATQGTIHGIRSGFHKFDNMTDGIQRGELLVIAARPSIGKTAIAVTIANSACVQDKVPTLIITCEMSQRSLMRRLVSVVSSVPMQTLKKGCITEGDSKALTAAQIAIGRAPLHFLDAIGGHTIASICTAIRRAVKSHGVQLVILDYLQKVRPTKAHEKRTYEVAEVSGRLKSIAVTEGVAVISLAQLNRESEKDKESRPRMTHLADSGQIERDADTLCLLHRERGEAQGDAELIVAKQRDGECGIVNLKYDGQFCRFESAHVDIYE